MESVSPSISYFALPLSCEGCHEQYQFLVAPKAHERSASNQRKTLKYSQPFSLHKPPQCSSKPLGSFEPTCSNKSHSLFWEKRRVLMDASTESQCPLLMSAIKCSILSTVLSVVLDSSWSLTNTQEINQIWKCKRSRFEILGELQVCAEVHFPCRIEGSNG